MSDAGRAVRNGLLAGGLAAEVGVAACWPYPLAALCLFFLAAGFAVGHDPWYDGRGWFTRRRRGHFATACHVACMLWCAGLFVRAIAGHPPGD